MFTKLTSLKNRIMRTEEPEAIAPMDSCDTIVQIFQKAAEETGCTITSMKIY